MLSGYATLLKKKIVGDKTYPGYPAQILAETRLRVGASVELDQTPFILYGDHLRLSWPGAKHSVGAISALTIEGLDKPVVRAYLKPFEARPDVPEALLQLIEKPEGGLECLLFTSEKLYPPNQDEWAAWLDEADGIIGAYTLTPPDGPSYNREWLTDTQDRVEPVTAWESFFTVDHETAPSRSRTHELMFYARGLGLDFDEYILLSAVREGRTAHVEILTGLPLNLTGQTII